MAERNNVDAPRIELTIQRTFDAPRDLLFKMWTETDHLNQWICPQGFRVTFSEGDLKVGGKFRSGMHSPGTGELIVYGVYKEITPPSRLVFTHQWENNGKANHETVVAITLVEQGDKTIMTFHQTGFASEGSRDGHRGGWSEAFEKLAAYIGGR